MARKNHGKKRTLGTEKKQYVFSSGLSHIHISNIEIVVKLQIFIYFLLFGWGKFNHN